MAPTVSYDIKAILRPLKGRTYVGFSCASCHKPVAVLQATEHRKEVRMPSAEIDVRCPSCGMEASHRTAELTRFVA